MLYEMCALKPAYDGNNLISLIFRIVKEAPKVRTRSYIDALTNDPGMLSVNCSIISLFMFLLY